MTTIKIVQNELMISAKEKMFVDGNLEVKTIHYMENEPKFVSQYIYIKK